MRFALFRKLSDLDVYQVAARHRKAVLQGEKAAVARLNASYNDARKAVKAQLRATIAKIHQAQKAGLPISMAWTNEQARLRQVLHTIELQMATFAGDAAKIALAQQKLAVAMGLGQSAELMKATIKGSFTVLDVGAFEDIIGFTAPGSPLYDLFKSFGPDSVAGAREVFAKGIALGWHPKQMARALDDVLQVPYRRALLITRTESNRARRTAALRNYRRNDHLIGAWEWSASHSPRTCAMCLAMDGTVHELSEILSSHPACRCAMVPVLKKGHSAPPKVGQDYFRELPEAEQDRILGKRKAGLFREGKIDLIDNVAEFDDPKWGKGRRPRTIKEVEQIAAARPPDWKQQRHVTGPKAPPVKKSVQSALERLREDLQARQGPVLDGLKDPVGVVLGGRQTAGAGGSNPGGFFTGTDGKRYYAKFYEDPAQAYGEHLANEVYRKLGLHAPLSAVTDHEGKTLYVSAILDNSGTLAQTQLTKDKAEAVMRGFAADCLIANWDAVGMSLDNIVLLPGGGVARIDNGGSFLMRARAGRKPTDRLGGLAEWGVFFSPKNAQYMKVAQAAGYSSAEAMGGEVIRQIKAIEKLRAEEGSWRQLVERTIPNLKQADKDAIVSMLEAREGELRKHRAKITLQKRVKRTGKKIPLGEAHFTLSDMWSVQAAWSAHGGYGWTGVHHEYYDQDHALFGQTAHFASSWCGSSTGTEGTKLIASLRELGKGQRSSSTAFIEAIIGTRRQRWENLARLHSLPSVPKSFTAWRGVKGKTVLRDVVAAWLDETEPFMRAKTRAAASWSLSESSARRSSFYQTVLYKAEIPFEQTFFDKWLDDNYFVSGFDSEHEIVCGGLTDDAIICSKADVIVKYQGREYTYAERQTLFDAMQRNGELPSPKSHKVAKSNKKA